MEQPILAVVALLCAVAAVVWGRSALRFQQSWHRIQSEYGDTSDQAILAGAAFRKELHAALLYGLLAAASGAEGRSRSNNPERCRPTSAEAKAVITAEVEGMKPNLHKN